MSVGKGGSDPSVEFLYGSPYVLRHIIFIGEPNNWGSRTEDCIKFGYDLWNKLINNNNEYDEGKFCDVSCSAIFDHHVCSSPPPSRVRFINSDISISKMRK